MTCVINFVVLIEEQGQAMTIKQSLRDVFIASTTTEGIRIIIIFI